MGFGSSAIRVFLIAEHAALRHNLALLLEGEGMIVLGAGGGTTRAPWAIPSGADVLIVALPTARPTALRRLQELCSHPGAPPSLVISPDDDIDSIHAALATGARGYVAYRRASEVLASAVREIARGGGWLPEPAGGGERSGSETRRPAASHRDGSWPARKGGFEPNRPNRHQPARGGRS